MLGEMKLWVGSWNMGARDPFMELGDLTANADAAARMLSPFVPLGLDVYVFGVQEGISDKMYEAIEQYTGTFRLPLHTKLYAPRDAKEAAGGGGGSGRSRRPGCAIRVSSLLAEARAGALPEPEVLFGSPGGRPRGPATLTRSGGLPLPAPGATLSVSWRYAPAPAGLLHGEEGPPDASRGVELPPARLRVVDAAGAAGADWWAETLTGGGALQQPAVDASMPYNVMVLSSTVAAFIAGGLINALARRAPKRAGAAAPAPERVTGGGCGEKKRC